MNARLFRLGVVLGAPLLMVGLPLVGVGVYFVQKAARVQAEQRAVTWSLTPMAGPSSAGAVVNARF